MASIWTDFGFRQSLYATTPIPPTAEGENLLVGRRTELTQLKALIESTSLHPTIEGDNGVGKTSLVAVAGYQLFRTYRNGNSRSAFVPLSRSFQLLPDDSVAAFRRRVMLEVAQELIERWDDLKGGGLRLPDIREMRKWLGKATLGSGGVGGLGFSASKGTTANTSGGFNDAGVSTMVEGWLRQIFPNPDSGGFVAVLDNLELLETSQNARKLLEAMRDEVLGIPGMRWVLCGSRGIVQTTASSTRLEGVLATPIRVGPLSDASVADVIRARRESYSLGAHAVAPVSPSSFRLLYDTLHRNLRNALSYADNFSMWLALNNTSPWDRGTNAGLFEGWLMEMADEHLNQTRLGGAAWVVFDHLVARGGSCSPGDHEEFGYATPMAIRPQFRALEEANMVTTAVDKDDARRRTISVSPRGWLVQYARSGYQQTY